MENYKQQLKERLDQIRRRINDASTKAGRDPSSVRLLMATKTVPVEHIRSAIELGEELIGENRVQELVSKSPQLADLDYECHFIGHLQTNKIKEVLKYSSCIQSVDRIDLAEKLDQRLQFEGRNIDILVQVNTSFEKSKFGLEPDKTFQFLKEIKRFNTLQIKGFMTIGLFSSDEEQVRLSFSRLREISQKAMTEGLIPSDARELSMGMSHDMEIAIEEGATIIRVGTAIFGERNYS